LVGAIAPRIVRPPPHRGIDGRQAAETGGASRHADRIWLADEDNHRILVLDRAHQPLGVLGTGKRGRSAGEFYQPEAVLARAPYVWVIDTYNDRIVLLRVE
jgi:hypothetical protein